MPVSRARQTIPILTPTSTPTVTREPTKVELELQPGDLLFVPGGAPHAVENLTDTIAVGGNFVDESNLPRVLAELRVLQERYPDAGKLAEALEARAACGSGAPP